MKNYRSRYSTAIGIMFVCLLACLIATQPAAGQTGGKCSGTDQSKTFVASLYLDILGREPSRGELQTGKNSIMQCSTVACVNDTRATLANNVFNLPEFGQRTGRNITDSGAFVEAVYVYLLRREPTRTERKAGIIYLDEQDHTREEFISQIIQSAAYRSRCFQASQRLIYFGWDSPTPAEMQNNWRTMQQQSFFDGITVELRSDAGTSVMQKVFTTFKVDLYSFTQVSAKMRTATDGWKNNKTFTDNFIRLMLSPPDGDGENEGVSPPYNPAGFSWNDDQLWIQINKNAGAAAKAARDAGMKGLLIDPEQYNTTKLFSCHYMWNRDFPGTPNGCSLPPSDPFTPAAYRPLLERRGKEFMESILLEYPDITIMTTFAHSAVEYIGRDMDLNTAFFDGMLKAINEKQQATLAGNPINPIHDGMEVYGRRTLAEYQNLYDYSLWAGWFYSGQRPLHERLIFAAPPVWLDNGRLWHSQAPFLENHYKPAQLERAVSAALQVTDRYVWVYTEHANLFGNGVNQKNVPQVYLDAMHRAKADAERAFVPAPVTATGRAQFVGTDAVTQGNWIGRYGSDGYHTAGNETSLPAYLQLSQPEQYGHWWDDTTEARAALRASGTSRSPRAWYSATGSPTIDFDLNFTDGQTHQVAMYCMDWIWWWNTENLVEISDADTGALLSRVSVSAFTGGKYLVWNLSGHVKIKVKYTAGSQPIVNGLYFGSVPTGEAVFIGTDTTTKGNWRAGDFKRYGLIGYRNAGNDLSLPSHAQLSMPDLYGHWWDDTTEERALLRPTGTSRTPRAWYSSVGSQTIDFELNLTDGQTHQLSLYCMDWLTWWNTAQTIEIRDAVNNKVLSSQSVSSFIDGKYMIWNVRGHVKVRLTHSSGQQPILNGIFLD